MPEITDAATLDFIVEGVMYDGFATVPAQPRYIMHFKVPENTIYIVVHSCNREKPLPVTLKTTAVSYLYVPLASMEDEGACPLIVTAITATGQKIWGFIDFVYVNKGEPKEILEATVFCNGMAYRAKGAFVCQARGATETSNGDIQKIGLAAEGVFATVGKNKALKGTPCNEPIKTGLTYYKMEVSAGICVYVFGTKDNKVFRLTMLGYKGVNL